MLAYGADQFRMAGGRVILQSSLSKGWTARVPKSLTHSEHPGTAVLWEDQYFEVVSAEPLASGRVRYTLLPWREEHVIRVFDHYDEASEAKRRAEWELAVRQQKRSFAARIAGIVLGHLPGPVQTRLANELGVTPSSMTLLSCLPPVVLFGLCVWHAVGGILGEGRGRVPMWLWLLAGALFAEAAVRFNIGMSQNRGVGTVFGFLAYLLFWGLSPNRAKLVSPFQAEKGLKVTISDTPDDIALHDSVALRSVLFTLLTPAEQARLASKYGYDYRREAKGVAWVILAAALLGGTTSFVKVADSGSVSALVSLIVAGALGIEQVVRLVQLERGPAGSLLAPLVRPFVRGLLERG